MKLTVAEIQQMKRDGKKIAGAICYDYQLAQILDRAGIDILTVGDSLGKNLLGFESAYEVTLDHMILFCGAVTRAAEHALVNCDMPFGPFQAGSDAAVSAAIRLVKEGHADTVKVDNAASNIEAVRAIARAGIPVWTQFGFSPQASMRIGDFGNVTADMANAVRSRILDEAKALQDAGASMLDLTHIKNPEIYAEVCRTVEIPVLGGSSHAGPEADGRITGFSYRAAALDGDDGRGRGDASRIIFESACEYISAVREARRL